MKKILDKLLTLSELADGNSSPKVIRLINELYQEVPQHDGKRLAEINRLQARIDELMIEYCPEDMTEEQIKTYEAAQAPATKERR